MKPAHVVPVAVIVIAMGLAFNTSASAKTEKDPGVGDASVYGTVVPTNEPAIGSGHDNVYANLGDGVPNVPNPGQYLFVQGCSTCHGANGEGSTQAPPLIGVGAAAVDFYLSTGRMPLNAPVEQAPRKKPAYTQPQIDEIVKYISTGFGAGGPEIPHVDTENADIVEGNILYANNCASCHNSQGSGGAVGRDHYAPNLYDATPTQIAEAIRIGPGAMSEFNSSTFNDEQVDSLVKYVGTLEHDDNPGGIGLGKLGPVSEGFVSWTIGLGLLLGIARWIGTRE